MNNQKGLAPILIIILIALVAGGYLIYQKQFKPVSITKTTQSTPTSTSKPESVSSDESVYTEATRSANWKTYTYKDSFSFKYPSGWYVYDFSDCLDIENKEAYAVAISLKPKDNFCRPEMTITFWSKGDESCYPEPLNTISSSDILIDNYQAKEIIMRNPRGTGRNETLIGFRRSSQCFVITNREQLVPEDIVNQILSTFKFIQ